jgi:hypothetical protein
MKNRLCLWGFLGLAGVFGVLVDSIQLMVFLLFFLLFALFWMEREAFAEAALKAARNAFAFFLFGSFTAFMFSSLLMKLFPEFMKDISFDVLLLLLIAVLSWSFALTVAVFIASILVGAALSRKKQRRGHGGYDGAKVL